MLRCCAILLFACAPFCALAAPVPREDNAAQMKRVFGKVDDPDKDCTFEFDRDKLLIKTPGNRHIIYPPFKYYNAPRVWKEVKGDFVATVRVAFPIRGPAPEHDHSGEHHAWTGAGLVAWGRGNEWLWLIRREDFLPKTDSAVEKFYRGRMTPSGGDGYLTTLPEKGDAYLRLTRSETKVAGSISRDGSKWVTIQTAQVGWGEVVDVGVVAFNATKAPFGAVFSDFAVTVPPK